MLLGRPITAVVPARGGSKGLPGKNMLRLGRHSLLERAILLGKNCSRVDRVVVSTDDPKMHALAARHDVSAPSLRPAYLASDTARTSDVIRHLIDQADLAEGWILLLQPTSPLRTLADLDGLFKLIESTRASSATSVVAHEEPRPEKLLKLNNGKVEPYLGGGYEGPRQALPQPYALNGAFYLIDRDLFVKANSFLPPGTVGFVMPVERSVNVDTPVDWAILKAMVETGNWAVEEYD